MSALIQSENCLWLVARDLSAGRIVASTVFEIDRTNRIGKITGMVVHPDYRHQRLAQAMLDQGTVTLLSRNGAVHSLYATTRTNSTGPQMVFLHEGYLPLGIFPNAHRIRDYDTLTLFAKFAPGVLDRRLIPERAPICLKRIYEIATEHLPTDANRLPHPFPAFVPELALAEHVTEPLDFEVISAPEYVQRRFETTFTDPYERFYPFHVPNTIFASTNGEVEIFAHHSKPDRYCTIVALTKPIYTLRGRIDDFFTRIGDHGISYLEVLIGVSISNPSGPQGRTIPTLRSLPRHARGARADAGLRAHVTHARATEFSRHVGRHLFQTVRGSVPGSLERHAPQHPGDFQ